MAENWVLHFVVLYITMNYRKEVKKHMSFYEYLIKQGINKERADAACVLIENDIMPEEPLESMYWTWWNNIILKKGDEI